MTSQDFLAWMEASGCRFASDIVRRLGVGRNIAQQWVSAAQEGQDVEIKPTVALAMAAVAADLKPWGNAKGDL